MNGGRTHLYVDEGKKGGYCIVAAVVPQADVRATSRRMFELLLPNQRRIHFKDENSSRKKQILDAIESTTATARIYVGQVGLKELAARRDCLERLARDVSDLRASRLVLERDDSVVEHDRRCLYSATRGEPALEYVHLRAYEEPLLWIADAIAWCWAAKGYWRDRVQSIVSVDYP